MKKRLSISESVSYLKTRDQVIEEEVQFIRSYRGVGVSKLARVWAKNTVTLKEHCLNDATEIAMLAFKLTASQAINLIYSQLPQTEEV